MKPKDCKPGMKVTVTLPMDHYQPPGVHPDMEKDVAVNSCVLTIKGFDFDSSGIQYVALEESAYPGGGYWRYSADWLEPYLTPPVTTFTFSLKPSQNYTVASPRDFDGFCDACSGFRFHRLMCPKKAKV